MLCVPTHVFMGSKGRQGKHIKPQILNFVYGKNNILYFTLK